MKRPLRHGYTTGACAAAAALGAARMLRDQRLHREVELPLPAGFAASFRLEGQAFAAGTARCHVVKDAGDDPDVTHGAELHAVVAWRKGEGGIVLEGGVGIGRVTKRGLAVPVGEWAINPVPRRMIEAALRSVFPVFPDGEELVVILSVPDGEERAKRTLNERLGIVGGLSVLGTTGVVKPISHKAWTDTLDVAFDVALAAGVRAVVLATGRSSERAAQQQLSLPEEAFVMMGDHVGYALETCHRKGAPRVILAVQFAKLVKIACGHPQTHVGSSTLDLAELARWARQGALDEKLAKTIECANTAREVYEELGAGHPLVAAVAGRALEQAGRWAPGTALAVLLVGYGDAPPRRFGDWTRLSAREGIT